MRVVLDTNVLVSGLLSENGPPGWIVDLVLSGDLEPVVDNRILAEYRDVLARPELKLPKDFVARLLECLERISLNVTAPPWKQALPDPDDEPFLAVAGHTDSILVTGNLKHYPPKARGGVRVLLPGEFLEGLRGSKD